MRETVVAAGARGSRQAGPRLGSATVEVARCYKRGSTLVQGASQGPRGGGTMTVLSGFPGVPAQKPGRMSLPQEEPYGSSHCSHEGGAGGTSARPAARGGRGVEPLLP